MTRQQRKECQPVCARFRSRTAVKLEVFERIPAFIEPSFHLKSNREALINLRGSLTVAYTLIYINISELD